MGALFFMFREEQKEPAPAPEPRPPVDEPAPPPPADLDLDVIVDISEDVLPATGTAFAIGDGLWMTARHVVDGCGQVGLILSHASAQGVRATEVDISPQADVAILRAPLSRQPMPLDVTGDEAAAARNGFHVGYPQGVPGEVASLKLGPTTLVAQGRYATREPVFAWAETSRTKGLRGTLGGISGGPAFNDKGDVIGITIAESPRRGRIYTAAPSSLAGALALAAAAPGSDAAPAGPLTKENYGDLAYALRRDLRVAKVVCQVGG